eukprot:GHVU01038857.1.p2 GENE.GHVU01038857.1~~GHVU01038857.1.p2  ORF type:complete len:114 (+),score=16.12 GHVU01038857.1:245-586(+)
MKVDPKTASAEVIMKGIIVEDALVDYRESPTPHEHTLHIQPDASKVNYKETAKVSGKRHKRANSLGPSINEPTSTNEVPERPKSTGDSPTTTRNFESIDNDPMRQKTQTPTGG